MGFLHPWAVLSGKAETASLRLRTGVCLQPSGLMLHNLTPPRHTTVYSSVAEPPSVLMSLTSIEKSWYGTKGKWCGCCSG